MLRNMFELFEVLDKEYLLFFSILKIGLNEIKYNPALTIRMLDS